MSLTTTTIKLFYLLPSVGVKLFCFVAKICTIYAVVDCYLPGKYCLEFILNGPLSIHLQKLSLLQCDTSADNRLT